MRQIYLAAYDIEDPRRRRYAHSLVREWAVGGQESAYECQLTASERDDLNDGMERCVDACVDRYLLLRLDPRTCEFTLGRATRPMESNLFYFP
jgi:CRISPR-associated protein Cas2